MKKVLFVICLCTLFIGIISINTRAQNPLPEKFIVFEEFVSPSDLPVFLDVQKQVKKLWDKYELEIPIYSYRTDESSFYWVIPIKNFASLDTLYASFIDLHKKMKDEDNFDADKSFKDLYSGRQTVINWSQELSYNPDGNIGQTSDKPYVEWMFCYMKSGHEKEAGDAVKKYIDFYNSIDETYQWDTYMAILGDDTPMWVFMSRAESALSMRQMEGDLNIKYKDDFMKMWTEFTTHVRRIENKSGWFMPKLSNNLQE